MKFWFSLFSLLMISSMTIAAEPAQSIRAKTEAGDEVVLHPNGRWEFTDTKKAEQAAAVAKEFPENQVCPPGSQGKFLGFGRCIPPGDKDFNRGSLSGKGR
jgi:V8-like Glu-specific endopeptidase